MIIFWSIQLSFQIPNVHFKLGLGNGAESGRTVLKYYHNYTLCKLDLLAFII